MSYTPSTSQSSAPEQLKLWAANEFRRVASEFDQQLEVMFPIGIVVWLGVEYSPEEIWGFGSWLAGAQVGEGVPWRRVS